MGRKGQQKPQGDAKQWHALLTDRSITDGLVVVFKSGLTYTVGEGWRTFTGETPDEQLVHKTLRMAYRKEADEARERGRKEGAKNRWKGKG